MRVEPIIVPSSYKFYGLLQKSTTGGVIPPPPPLNFKCYVNTTEKIRDYGKVIKDTGFINGKKLDIYSAYSRTGKLVHKLYYLADGIGNWIKSKLKYYNEDGKCYKTLRSER